MRFELFVAFRYLMSKRHQGAVSIVTVISVVGVTAGVMSLVIALAVNNGFKEDLENRLVGATANVSLLRTENDGIRDYDRLVARVLQLPHVVGAAPAVYERVLISSGSRARGVVLKGIDPDREIKVSHLLNQLTEGSFQELSVDSPEMPPLILGKELAENLGAVVGAPLMVTSIQGRLTPFGPVPKFREFRVVGIFDSGFYDFDSSWVFTDLRVVQKLFDLVDVVSVVEIKLDDIYIAPEVAKNVERAAGEGFSTTHWMEQNRSLFSALALERLVTALTIGLIVFVAALNIFITLTMLVMEKRREIAVLMSMGARPGQIWSVFTLYGLLIGLVGTLLGLVAGYAAAGYADAHKLIRLQAEIYSIAFVPFQARPADGVLIGLAALTICFLATLYPSLSAARLNPVEILRYE